MGNLKRLVVQSRPLDGRDRLAVLHGQMYPGGREPFRFEWKDIPKTGMGTVDQFKAIKTIKEKISDIGRMKAEEQKKAVRAGYDMEILPPDLINFSKDAAELLSDLQSRNERIFLLTFTVVNLAPPGSGLKMMRSR